MVLALVFILIGEVIILVNNDDDFRELWEDYAETVILAEANENDIELISQFKILKKELEEEINAYLNRSLQKKSQN